MVNEYWIDLRLEEISIDDVFLLERIRSFVVCLVFFLFVEMHVIVLLSLATCIEAIYFSSHFRSFLQK